MAPIGYGYGSEWHLLQYLGRRRAALTEIVEVTVARRPISWADHNVVAVEDAQTLREPKGLEFLKAGHAVRREWESVWPQTGNVHNWDAVAHAQGAEGEAWILVEAKAHLGELPSSCGAVSEASTRRIHDVLTAVRHDLGVRDSADWMIGHYQYCNRVALLHFLVKRGIDAHLLFVYFIGDRTDLGRPGRVCPTTEGEWKSALDQRDRNVGIPEDAEIRRRIHSVFLPAFRVEVATTIFKPQYIRSALDALAPRAAPVRNVNLDGASNTPRRFARYVGIDYSGARTPDDSCSGLRVFVSDGGEPREEPAPAGFKHYWTRRGLAEWLTVLLSEGVPTIVGIDHAFSFPLKYFEKYGLERDWDAFLTDFQSYWPTDREHMYVDFAREGPDATGHARTGNARWRRLTETVTGSAKSVFHFDVPGQVAKSTHAGLPWLRHLRQRATPSPHFWPFDGWEVQEGRSVVVEVYPRLWRTGPPPSGWTEDQWDAFATCEWLRRSDVDGTLAASLAPSLDPADRSVASIEGWILGASRPAGHSASTK